MNRVKDSLTWLRIHIALFKNWYAIYIAFFSKRLPVLTMRTGVRFRISSRHDIVTIAEIWYRNVYGTLDEIANIKDPVIIDIGANIGCFTALSLWKLPRAKVIACEPEPDNISLLRDMVRLNNWTGRCVIVPEAITETSGTMTLFLVAGRTHSLFKAEKATGEVVVQCTTLEQVMKKANVDKCDFLKIDCEGAEYGIIRSGPRSLWDNVSKVVVEWHEASGHTMEELETLLRNRDFEVRRHPESKTVLIATRSPR